MMKLMQLVPMYLWLLISVLIFGIGEYLSKVWGRGPSLPLTGLIAVVYALGAIFWLPAIMKQNDLARLGTIWNVMSIIVTISIGLFIFKETLSIVNWTGIILALIAIVLIQL